MRKFGVIKINEVDEGKALTNVNVSYCEYSTNKSGWFQPSYVTNVWKTSKKTDIVLNAKQTAKFSKMNDTKQKLYLSSLLNR